MPKCKACGEEFAEGSKYCPACGAAADSTEQGYSSTRKQVFVGEVRKCPSCGSELQSLAAICPTCGYELNSGKLNSSVRKLAELLEDGEKWGYLTRERKTNMIETHPIPNDKESIVEFLYYIKMRLAAMTNDKITGDLAYWNTVWKMKADNIYQKAQVILKNDPMVEQVYKEICEIFDSIKAKYTRKKFVRLIVGLAALAGLGFLIYLWIKSF